ncbi:MULTISPECIES: hypothetical protein [unclassified Bradyrhizobium]|uniref:hypothetical protein n=1 Tax=unclassified Bradyrhizobium TaxID=2631580 RepID=UPI001BA52FCB|nr:MULTISPECIES: hypothetical protein [unclassified Bradyrhizobium]MBR1207530.1 hypothetical protein [Bradyrhizobium sp. AUGA SZCCT0124]MBR1315946.1 hypothetical protein [Bradyrhizobium sp. AUGA SZCCT0051]MBR1344052.1 hypothetical protein [Bradyrhizobium sp. AUGA SZCCT0105]MBR1357961.1 hypothetical protein [Bradyrhizobium sp. AUGA SZCCT0045]
MSEDQIKLSGKIVHVFAHRFVVQTANGAVLADLTPHGADLVKLRIGADVELEGEQKPSELKVTRFACGRENVMIQHKRKPDHGHHEPADSATAIEAARAAGFEPVGAPRRKPKHFEIEGRRNGETYELHVELGGRIRKAKLVGNGHEAA